MNSKITIAATTLRLLFGWFMTFAGLEKVFDPNWTAKGFLLNAKTFPDFYAWFAQPMNTWWVDPLNAWGITLIGVALLVGVAVRPAAWAGAVLMILYYFPQNIFPNVPHGYIVEEHIIYATALVLIAIFPQAQQFGLGSMLRRIFLGRIPVIKSLI
ncbi:MAG: DoxX family protein [bacterium]|nr:DoxX family protein [bacterium]